MVGVMRKGVCDDSDALTRDVVARVECVASESHPRHSVVDLRYLLSGSVMILVYPPIMLLDELLHMGAHSVVQVQC